MIKSLTATLLLALPFSANAQSGFPEGFNASTGSISIGESSEQIQRFFDDSFVGLADVEPNPAPNRNTPWKTGYKFESADDVLPPTGETFLTSQGAAEVTQANMADFKGKYTGNHISVTYGSPLSGNVVEAVKRSQNFDPPLDFRTVLEVVETTYGEPHGALNQGRSLFYGFVDGKPMQADDKGAAAGDIQQRCLQRDSAPRNIVSRAYSGGSYTLGINQKGLDFFGPIARRTVFAEEMCDAVMAITINMNSNQLVTNMEVYMIDISMMAADQKLTEGVLTGPSEPVGSMDVPKL